MKSHLLKILSTGLLIILTIGVLAQEIPDERILEVNQLAGHLKTDLYVEMRGIKVNLQLLGDSKRSAMVTQGQTQRESMVRELDPGNQLIFELED